MKSKVAEWLKRKPMLAAVLTLVSGSAMGQIISLVTTPIVSRIYDNDAYGKFAIVVSTATIICTISQAGLASAIMMPEDKREAKEVFMSAFWLQLVISTLFIVAVTLISPVYRLFEIGISYFLSLLLLFFYIILTNVSNLLRIYMNRQKKYRVLFWNSIIGALSTLLITIPLGLLKWGAFGFISAALVAAVISALQMGMASNPYIKLSPHTFTKIVKKYKDFIIFQFPANMLATVAIQLPNQTLDKQFGSAQLGNYSMCEKVFGVPSRLIAAPINTVYFKTAVEYKQQKEILADFTYSLIRKVMLAGAIPLLLLLRFGGPIFAFVLGEQWLEAGQLAGILGFSYVFSFCSICTSYCRVALDKQKLNLFMALAQVGIIAASLFLGLQIQPSVTSAVIAFSIGNCIVQMIDMFINFRCMEKNAFQYLAFSVSYVIVLGGIGLVLNKLIAI